MATETRQGNQISKAPRSRIRNANVPAAPDLLAIADLALTPRRLPAFSGVSTIRSQRRNANNDGPVAYRYSDGGGTRSLWRSAAC